MNTLAYSFKAKGKPLRQEAIYDIANLGGSWMFTDYASAIEGLLRIPIAIFETPRMARVGLTERQVEVMARENPDSLSRPKCIEPPTNVLKFDSYVSPSKHKDPALRFWRLQ